MCRVSRRIEQRRRSRWGGGEAVRWRDETESGAGKCGVTPAVAHYSADGRRRLGEVGNHPSMDVHRWCV